MKRTQLVLFSAALLVAAALWISARSRAASSGAGPGLLEQFLAWLSGMSPNVVAFLTMLSIAEGTEQHGYYTLFGGEPFLELDTHPAVRTYGEWLEPGKQNFTTAAGRYQETLTTWRRLSAKLGTTDFSPATQDAHALELIREAGALEDVEAGRFDEAVRKLGGIWASLPSSSANQGHRTLAFVQDAYQDAGGAIA